MATCKDCKDCFHYELCGVFDYISPVECGFYTERSRFVEFPCKVGDRLYVTIPKSKYIAEYVVIAFWVEESGTIIRIVDTRFFTLSILFVRDIGTKAFFTRQEAEQVLKEREGEA